MRNHLVGFGAYGQSAADLIGAEPKEVVTGGPSAPGPGGGGPAPGGGGAITTAGAGGGQGLLFIALAVGVVAVAYYMAKKKK